MARHDLDRVDRAYDALDDGSFSYAVFHSQQCVEKIVKAALEMEEVFSRDHDVSDLFSIFILKKESEKNLKEKLYAVLEVIEWFRGKWSVTRYPVIINGEVKSPVDIFGKNEANEAVTKAQFVYDAMIDYLNKRYDLTI